ncbi:MAG: tetratricopeptide repeat protein, partial [Candidatus Heimdallarchaeota archaeon]|nr:tetratricopeptide repeat protein [Candidatus Heimdallarchaeota archaeon]
HYYALGGELLMYDKKYHKAILYLNKSLQIRQGLFESIHPLLAMNYNNIGYCHAQLKQAPQAKKAYIESLHIFKRIHRHHSWLPFLLHNIAELYSNRMLGNICIRYGRKISKEKPGLLKDAGITEPFQPVVIPEKKDRKKIQPKVKIFLIATSDMKNFRQCLSEKIIAMVNYYQGDLPELCLCEYVQGNSEKSKKVLYKMIRKESYKSFYTTFICLVGEEYGPAANLYPEIISMVPWATDYRDRADWEIILRTCIQSGTNGTIYHLGKKKVPRVDIQHPYLKVQSLIREYQHRDIFPEVEIKTMRKADQDTIEHIMFKLNLVVLQAKKRFASETFNVSVSK